MAFLPPPPSTPEPIWITPTQVATIAPLTAWIDLIQEVGYATRSRKSVHPVESGSSIIDHAVVEPEQIRLRAIVLDIATWDGQHPSKHTQHLSLIHI